jgi:predicted HicB family RNase H-like nuclease
MVVQFTLRVDDEVLRQTKHRAVDASMSQNEYIVHLMKLDTGVHSTRPPQTQSSTAAQGT